VTHETSLRDGTGGEARAEVRPASDPSWIRQIELVVQSLRDRLGASAGLDRIRAEVEAGFAAFSQARVREFVPILVEARVRSHLSRPPRAGTPDD
jgi:hypothetical protein